MKEFQHLQTQDLSKETSAVGQSHGRTSSGHGVDISAEIMQQISRSPDSLLSRLAALKDSNPSDYQHILRAITETQGNAFVNRLLSQLAPAAEAPRQVGSVAKGYKPLDEESSKKNRAAFDAIFGPDPKATHGAAAAQGRLSDSTQPILQDVIAQTQPSPLPMRSQLEDRFGESLGHLQVHQGAIVDAFLTEHSARGAAIGQHILLKDNATSHTIAEEIAHSKQQGLLSDSDLSRLDDLPVSQPSDATEYEARVIADQFVSGQPLALVSERRTPHIARQSNDQATKIDSVQPLQNEVIEPQISTSPSRISTLIGEKVKINSSFLNHKDLPTTHTFGWDWYGQNDKILQPHRSVIYTQPEQEIEAEIINFGEISEKTTLIIVSLNDVAQQVEIDSPPVDIAIVKPSAIWSVANETVENEEKSLTIKNSSIVSLSLSKIDPSGFEYIQVKYSLNPKEHQKCGSWIISEIKKNNGYDFHIEKIEDGVSFLIIECYSGHNLIDSCRLNLISIDDEIKEEHIQQQNNNEKINSPPNPEDLVAELGIHVWIESSNPLGLKIDDLERGSVGHAWISISYFEQYRQFIPESIGNPTKHLMKNPKYNFTSNIGFYPIRAPQGYSRSGEMTTNVMEIDRYDYTEPQRVNQQMADGPGYTPGNGDNNDRSLGRGYNKSFLGIPFPAITDVPGRVEEPDIKHLKEVSASKIWKVKLSEILSILSFINENKNKEYNLYHYNCSHFAVAAVASAGKTVGGITLVADSCFTGPSLSGFDCGTVSTSLPSYLTANRICNEIVNELISGRKTYDGNLDHGYDRSLLSKKVEDAYWKLRDDKKSEDEKIKKTILEMFLIDSESIRDPYPNK